MFDLKDYKSTWLKNKSTSQIEEWWKYIYYLFLNTIKRFELSLRVYEKRITASEVRWKLIIILKEDWSMFPDRRTSITLLDQNQEYETVLDVPNEALRRIRTMGLNKWIKDNESSFVEGSLVKITLLDNNKYSIEISDESSDENETGEGEIQDEQTFVPHIDLLVKLYKIGKCDDDKYVYIGLQERSRVTERLGEKSDPLGPYLTEQAERTGNDRIKQLDCIFLIEDDNLIIPKVVFEVELSRNYDAIINRIDALITCLSSRWYREILQGLTVVIVVPNDRMQFLENRVEEQGQWQRIRNHVRIQVWGVSHVEECYRSLVDEGNFQRTQILT